ncbi:MAG: pantoate--beta-alanine ligase [Muribaculaceae bacterium]|nr:pantoate--beta-alanine ligase [Muribaculaceae bacterium]
MEIITTVSGLRSAVAAAKAEGKTIGLVPTMGALHAGHISLVERARRECDFVIVSVFVNPTQFNNQNDLNTYPRTVEADCALLEEAGVDVAFVPTVEEIYPEPDTRQFDLGPVAEVMEGAMRPGHFNGVAQIVSKLFDYAQPDRAYFGEKDFQQIAVIRSMADIIGFKGEIVPCEIVREVDGLAMSSRNVRLNAEQRAAAPEIHQALLAAAELAQTGLDLSSIYDIVVEEINSNPLMEVEYFDIVDAETLQPVYSISETRNGAVGCITVWMGDVRLIDNIKFPKN